MNIMTTPICQHCENHSVLTDGSVIYPHRPDLGHKLFYHCAPCGAFVGCHPGTTTPLGSLANAPLRAIRQQAHQAFDPIWKSGEMPRSQAYHWLAKELGLGNNDCHIGMFTEPTCRRVIEICAARDFDVEV